MSFFSIELTVVLQPLEFLLVFHIFGNYILGFEGFPLRFLLRGADDLDWHLMITVPFCYNNLLALFWLYFAIQLGLLPLDY
jgi:hypothetical protein